MIQSMTAFARLETQGDWGQAIWEIRNVNHRYLDIHFKLPDFLREYESHWRQAIQAVLARGKVECTLQVRPSPLYEAPLKINEKLVTKLMDAVQQLQQHTQHPLALNAMDCLRWPEVMVPTMPAIAPLKAPITELLQQTLSQLLKGRLSEGASIAQSIQRSLQALQLEVDRVRARWPMVMAQHRQKIQSQAQNELVDLNLERLEQEMLYYAQRLDISEELARLAAHIQQGQLMLGETQSVGRKLDFLMQELNREANTLTAKSTDLPITQAALAMKSLIEQMREQVQNIA